MAPSTGVLNSSDSGMMQVLHHKNSGDAQVAMEFQPAFTVKYSSFQEMIRKSRTDTSFGPFLTGLRICMYPEQASRVIAVRDSYIYDGNLRCKQCASSRLELMSIAKRNEFAHIKGFSDLVRKAIDVLDREHPDWFDMSREGLALEHVNKSEAA
jgi:hypothetical protein